MSDALTVEPTTEPLFTASDLAAINRVRDILDKIQQDAMSMSHGAPVYNGLEANSGDYARVSERAHVASDALFDLLNLTNACRAQTIPGTIMHRREGEVPF